jgi:hypothetical protein
LSSPLASRSSSPSPSGGSLQPSVSQGPEALLFPSRSRSPSVSDCIVVKPYKASLSQAPATSTSPTTSKASFYPSDEDLDHVQAALSLFITTELPIFRTLSILIYCIRSHPTLYMDLICFLIKLSYLINKFSLKLNDYFSKSILLILSCVSICYVYFFLFINNILCDAPRAWGIYFQDSASPQMEALVELHDNIMYYLSAILFSVG